MELQERLEKNCIRVRGGKALHGSVKPDGAKNSALIQLAALALVENNFVTLRNVPPITDVDDSIKMLEEVGFHVKKHEDEVTVTGALQSTSFSSEYGSKIRASLAFLGSVISRKGEIKLPLPGGDKIGPRPIDIHIAILNTFGVKTVVEDDFLYCKADLPLKGASAVLRYPSVLATVNGILLGVLAEGRTELYNVAKEPEIVDLTNLLSKMGADIRGVGTDRIVIHGVKVLKSTYHEVMPDRLEAAALIMALVASGGSGTIEQTIPEHNTPLLNLLKHTGVTHKIEGDKIHIIKSECFRGFHAEARPYPALATDIQPLIAPLALKCPGISKIVDTVHHERFSHVDELKKIGAEVDRIDNAAYINGNRTLNSGTVAGHDIRSVVSLINAALIYDEEILIYGLEHLNRGHKHFIDKLNRLGADIEMI